DAPVVAADGDEHREPHDNCAVEPDRAAGQPACGKLVHKTPHHLGRDQLERVHEEQTQKARYVPPAVAQQEFPDEWERSQEAASPVAAAAVPAAGCAISVSTLSQPTIFGKQTSRRGEAP